MAFWASRAFPVALNIIPVAKKRTIHQEREYVLVDVGSPREVRAPSEDVCDDIRNKTNVQNDLAKSKQDKGNEYGRDKICYGLMQRVLQYRFKRYREHEEHDADRSGITVNPEGKKKRKDAKRGE